MSDSETADRIENNAEIRSGSLRDNISEPIVLNYKAKKKKKKKRGKVRYSRGLADVQRLDGQLTRIGRRWTGAVAKGISTYDRERKSSAKKKRDGSIKDFVPNVGEAWSASLVEASKLPSDVAKLYDSRTSRRILRQQLRLVSSTVRVLRL